MKNPAEVYSLLQESLVHDAHSMRAKRKERQKHSRAFHRCLELDREMDDVRHHLHIVMGLLGPTGVAATLGADATGCLSEALERTRSPQETRERLTLWRAIREYLRLVGEASVSEIQELLESLKVSDFTRQAIESALHNHEDIFAIKKKGRERLISLKERERSA